jgi:hypothetical protein
MKNYDISKIVTGNLRQDIITLHNNKYILYDYCKISYFDKQYIFCDLYNIWQEYINQNITYIDGEVFYKECLPIRIIYPAEYTHGEFIDNISDNNFRIIIICLHLESKTYATIDYRDRDLSKFNLLAHVKLPPDIKDIIKNYYKVIAMPKIIYENETPNICKFNRSKYWQYLTIILGNLLAGYLIGVILKHIF